MISACSPALALPSDFCDRHPNHWKCQPAPPPTPPPDKCIVAPASIQAAIDANPVGTSFCLSGTFSISTPLRPKDGQSFTGPAVIRGVNGNDSGFVLRGPDADNVIIDGLEMYGFDLRAVECWDGTVVRNSYFHHNLRNGMGCGNAIGVVIEDSEFAYNGSAAELGIGAAGVKMAVSGDRGRGTGVIMRGNYAHHNIGMGLWCDIDCANDVIENNRTEFNSRDGIQYEISWGPVMVRDNVVRFNNTDRAGAHGGILFNSSCPSLRPSSCTVTGNTLEGNNLESILIRDDTRPYAPPFDITVTNNDVDEPVTGCNLAGVTCS